MATVLVVNHEIDLEDQEAESLRRFGYTVEQCSGPTANTCPVLAGRVCPMAERADVLVYDAWASGDADGAKALINGLRELHPTIPVVLTVAGMDLDWIEESGPHKVIPVMGQPTGARLDAAIREALGTVPA